LIRHFADTVVKVITGFTVLVMTSHGWANLCRARSSHQHPYEHEIFAGGGKSGGGDGGGFVSLVLNVEGRDLLIHPGPQVRRRVFRRHGPR
jgi:hypothetical protein